MHVKRWDGGADPIDVGVYHDYPPILLLELTCNFWANKGVSG